MEGSCYPATGNLLIGRAINLTATSTCGLDGPEQYCIDLNKCFKCDSQMPYDAYHHDNSHRVENVIYHRDSRGELTWWQSVNGEENVSIRLNLEAEFHFTHFIMKFKTFRPAAMIIERSSDFGRTWRPYRYFAYNCTKTFPWIPAHSLQFIDEVICEERYSDIEPSTEGEVSVLLDPAIHVKDPYSLDIQDLLRITNLRINFTKLRTLGDNLLDRRPDVLQKYYYALYELVVRGSCFCYGHASECAPVPGVTSRDLGMIHGRCVCKHNTVGLNCERCRDFYHDAPWRPAETDNAHTCRECNCNGHSNQCHFDMAVYLATGNISGGVCDNCLHNTMGRNCETCKYFYYQDPTRDIRDPAACIPCDCDPVGSVEGGLCDSNTDLDLGMIGGQCRCKQNVKGQRCDYCKEGHYGLSPDIPLGCQPCNCDPRGITMIGAPCDQISGDCSCKRYVTSRYCDQCLPEYWGLSNDLAGCRPCDCDFGGATSNRMDNGQCDCRPHLIGRQCSEAQPAFFCASLDYNKYEAEEAIGRSPDDPTLPVSNAQFSHFPCRSPHSTFFLEWVSCCVQMFGVGKNVFNGVEKRLLSSPRLHYIEIVLTVCRVYIIHNGAVVYIVYTLTVHRERQPGQMVTWTGPGFARVKDGAGLEFTISNIPYAMEYDIMIRYEPEVCGLKHLRDCFETCMCCNFLTTVKTSTAPCWYNYIIVETSVDLIMTNAYSFSLSPQLVLIPRYDELPGFRGDDAPDESRRQEMELYMCLDSFMTLPMPALAELCTTLICSISAIMYNGALGESHSDEVKAEDPSTMSFGGQCHCKPNVIGRKCDQCAPGTYGFGPYGCTVCDCHSQGSVGHQCDPVTGQCPCQHGATGRQCSECQPGQWGFPNCRQCQCNGHAESCDPETGACYECRDYTAGQLCERCVNGFYGNPILGSGEHCHPCPCPGHPDSGHSNGASCHTDYASNQILCQCGEGYAGPRCDRCAPGYYGDPQQPGGTCWPCQCNGNIDPQDPESCDPQTGQCLRCLYNTDGHSCSECKPGYYGNALAQDCRRCTCVTAGTVDDYCTDGVCHCDKRTGQCPCKPNIIGHNCDQCTPNHWNFGSVFGCELCECAQPNSLSTHCNMFSGQCHCQPGFGGRQCSECEAFHWGDPRVQCEECNCHPLGSEIAQCDRVTGACVCKEEASGRRCDECARGFTGNFPKCVPCHPCFQLWDDAVCQIGRDLTHIKDVIAMILEKGEVPGVNDSRIRELEKKLAQIQDLIRNGDREGIYNLISQTIDDLSDAFLFFLCFKVCGGHGNASANSSCPDSPCGGAGCRDSDGMLKCGGKGCKGTVGASLKALDNADDLHKNLTTTSEELQTIAKKLRDIATLTQTVKTQAKDTLDKAQGKKELFESSNKMLKDFIQKIRDFLNEEGADPESIEKVAQQVLAISLPVNRTVILNIVEQIKANIANLTNVEGVFNHTSESELICFCLFPEQLDNKLFNLDSNLMGVMMRLANLSHGVVLLKNKTEQNREMAKDAKAQSDNATQEAAGLQEVCVCVCVHELVNAENLYNELKEKVDSVGGTGEGNISQKAIEMKKEAEELLKKATTGMETLRSMSKCPIKHLLKQSTEMLCSNEPMSQVLFMLSFLLLNTVTNVNILRYLTLFGSFLIFLFFCVPPLKN
uniref:Laminin subunit beta-2-like n=1 Tax=Sinocyclocheilus grahami TaxID=75366 RepID=A0A672SL20_SINGR